MVDEPRNLNDLLPKQVLEEAQALGAHLREAADGAKPRAVRIEEAVRDMTKNDNGIDAQKVDTLIKALQKIVRDPCYLALEGEKVLAMREYRQAHNAIWDKYHDIADFAPMTDEDRKAFNSIEEAWWEKVVARDQYIDNALYEMGVSDDMRLAHTVMTNTHPTAEEIEAQQKALKKSGHASNNSCYIS